MPSHVCAMCIHPYKLILSHCNYDEENECEYTDTKSDLLDNESEDISIGSELEEEAYSYSDED